MDVLREMRDTHGPRFTNHVNVDLHSGGGWSPEFWSQAAVSHLPTLPLPYPRSFPFSPSPEKL